MNVSHISDEIKDEKKNQKIILSIMKMKKNQIQIKNFMIFPLYQIMKKKKKKKRKALKMNLIINIQKMMKNPKNIKLEENKFSLQRMIYRQII